MTSQVRLLIADDHHLFLDGVVSLLKDVPDFNIVSTASNGFDVLDYVSNHPVDICILDISMPGLDGIATAKRLREKKPELKIIILTTYNDQVIIDEMAKIGVSGYLLKNCTKAELIDCIRKVSNGQRQYGSEAQRVLVDRYTSLLHSKESKVVLTQRELEILRLLAKEFTNDRIAEELKISFRTVETHRKNMMQKTKAHNLAGLLTFAFANGILK
jgi:DNA-binding NarL/FixJ family response regulator